MRTFPKSHTEWLGAMVPEIESAIQDYKIVTLVGKIGTGKTCLARTALPHAFYIDLSRYDGTLVPEGRNVIFDELHAVKPTSAAATAVRAKCSVFEGIIVIFQTEQAIADYLPANTPFELFDLDTHTHRSLACHPVSA